MGNGNRDFGKTSLRVELGPGQKKRQIPGSGLGVRQNYVQTSAPTLTSCVSLSK